MHRIAFCLISSWAVTHFLLCTAICADEKLQFNRDIRPILSAACYRCHGFDAKARQGDLRLDVAEDALKQRDTGAAVVPGKLDKSLVWQRITSNDPDLVMPPPDAIRQLTATERETIKRWIEEGGTYQKHWALEPLEQPAVPEPVKETEQFAQWTKNPIDRFLLKRIIQAGLTPQPRADRSTLIRRVAITLTGLPPTIAEVEEFENDMREDAYERMVERYFQSPAHGEEMAKHWLDVARYGDTHGLHLDNVRDIWAYRDWVVQAFNSNQPFDQFTIEQLAGDLLPKPTQAQLVATGFNRCNVTTSEGGAIKDEFLFRYAVDRASTTIQTWLGMTGGCAVCHDHKYDPLTMNEFYSFYAFFYSAADPAMDGNASDTPPYITLPKPEQTAEIERLAKVEADLERTVSQLADALATKALSDEKKPEATESAFAFEDIWLNDSLPLGASGSNTTRNREKWATSDEMEIPLGSRALRLAFGDYYQQKIDGGITPRVLPEEGQLSFWIRIDPNNPSQAFMLELNTSSGQRRFAWGATERLRKGEFGSGNNRAMGDLPQTDKWHEIKLTLAQLNLPAGATVNDLLLSQFGGVCWIDGLKVAGPRAAKTDPRNSVDNWLAYGKGKAIPVVPKEVAEVLKSGKATDVSEGTRFQIQSQFFKYIARDVPTELALARAAWLRARDAKLKLEQSIPGTMIYNDLAEPRTAHVMKRGQYDQPGDAVEPGTPKSMPGLQPADPKRATRLDLAKWLVSKEHPLTARVTVNRFWQQIFGIGLVKTSDDFGTQGEAPSHPELLDWLAAEYRNHGWNTRELIRLMVTSAAFQQSSHVDEKVLKVDPQNRLLAHGPRIRLDAEQVRDNSLAISGLLNRRIGGPGFLGYQPPNIWEPVGYGDSNTRYYLQDYSADVYRRSLYSFIKRTAPPPFMSNFDAPNREMFCSRRERGNTPLQALQLMNDIQHFEAARGLAERMLREGGVTAKERLDYAMRLAVARRPNTEEVDLLERSLQQFTDRFEKDKEAATKALAVGLRPVGSTFDKSELAAYTLVANLILNLDETVNRN